MRLRVRQLLETSKSLMIGLLCTITCLQTNEAIREDHLCFEITKIHVMIVIWHRCFFRMRDVSCLARLPCDTGEYSLSHDSYIPTR